MNLKHIERKTETKVVEVQPEKIVIELDMEEARMLTAVVGSVLGETKLRTFTDKMYHALVGWTGLVNEKAYGIISALKTKQ